MGSVYGIHTCVTTPGLSARRWDALCVARGPIMTPDLDLKALPNVYDPFPLYAWLRDHEPVHWSASLNAWAVTRYADVLEIFSQPIRFSSDRFRKVDEKYASRRPAVRAVGDVLDYWLVF